MEKFKVNNQVIEDYKGMRYSFSILEDEIVEYTFYNTPNGTISIKTKEDYTHHDNVFMVLLELDYLKDSSDMWWNNTTSEVDSFKKLLESVLHNEYMKQEFPKTTEWVINLKLKELNSLIDHTKYWTDGE